jgi:hypothetical protein
MFQDGAAIDDASGAVDYKVSWRHTAANWLAPAAN